jgi:hypothetical protein
MGLLSFVAAGRQRNVSPVPCPESPDYRGPDEPADTSQLRVNEWPALLADAISATRPVLTLRTEFLKP